MPIRLRIALACVLISGASPGLPSAAAADRLAGDEQYVRQGAITNMATCLNVAADAGASALWRTWVPERFGIPERQAGLAAWLVHQDDDNRPGFGTLLACAQIVRTWQHVLTEQLPSLSLDPGEVEDGRLQHGTLVIDLGRTGGRSFIEPQPLIRLLSSPGLVPRLVYGGIAVRNAVIADTLLFNNLHLGIPLAFVDTRFYANGYSKRVFGKEPIAERSITITNSRFEDHVLLADSIICGDIGIFDTRFSETFELHNVHHGAAACAEPDPMARDPVLRIDSSSFEQSLRITHSSFRHTSMASNTISSILWADADFGRSLELSDNDIGSFLLDRVQLGELTSISYNRIANDFFIWDYGEGGERRVKRVLDQLDIMSNRIGGGLGLGGSALAALPGPEDAREAPFELNLMSNHVGNGSVICLPAAWPGRVTLAGSSYSGTLTLGARQPDAPLSDACNDAFRAVARADLEQRMDGTYCAPILEGEQDRLVVELMATEIRTLRWHLPLDCAHRWRGFGLSYKLWLPDQDPRFRSSDWSWEEMAFRAWRTTLAGYEPAPLHTMSQYLAGNGAYVPSRMIQTEAKRLNYAPDCAPHETFPACLFGAPWFSAAEAAPDGTGAEPGGGPDDWLTRAVQKVTLIFLFPAGYGAVPERALLFLAFGMLGFGILYSLYIRRARWRFEQAQRLLPPVLDRLKRHIDAISQPTPDGGALAERAQKILAAHAMLPAVSDDSYRESLARLVQDAHGLARLSGFSDDDLQTSMSYLKYAGTTDIHGFSRFNMDKLPTRFTPWRYSIDTMLPVIDLHAYSSYYPEWRVMRGISVIQHICGWWWLTVFIASAAIL